MGGNMEIKLFSMFSGLGGAEFALKKAGIPFECVGYSEIDKFAIQCYEQNHVEKWDNNLSNGGIAEVSYPTNYGDCTKINPEELPDFNLLTAGFPCQSFSIAGKRKGFEDTRGTLFGDIIKIAKVKQPKYIILENVKGLTNHEKGKTFEIIKKAIEQIGYHIKYKVRNTKHHGIPQNRERIWIIAFKDKKEKEKFEFPEKEELKIKIKDILEDQVEEKYYLSQKAIKRINRRNKIKQEGIAPCMTKNMHKGNESMPTVYSLYPRTGKGEKNENYYMSGKIYNKGDCAAANRIFKPKAIATIQSNTRTKILIKERIRKLTPKECFRLQGIYQINTQGISNTQQYKLCGNGWAMQPITKILKKIFN